MLMESLLSILLSVTWRCSSTAGTYGGIARQAGDYVYTLQTNSTAGDNVSEQFSYRITNGSNTSTSSLTIRVVDDAPVGNDVTQTLTASTTTLTYNLTIVFDVSGSMGNWSVAGRAWTWRRMRWRRCCGSTKSWAM